MMIEKYYNSYNDFMKAINKVADKYRYNTITITFIVECTNESYVMAERYEYDKNEKIYKWRHKKYWYSDDIQKIKIVYGEVIQNEF